MAKPPSNRITAGDIQDLAVAVEQLTEETRILRTAIDELRDDVVWAARQVLSAGDAVAPGYGFCRQRDPFAPDAGLQPRSEPPAETNESIEYCCQAPRLAWSGDPDAPSVECQNCGYVVAESGQIVSGYDNRCLAAETESGSLMPEAGKDAEVKAHQGTLFLDDSSQEQ